MPRKTTKPSVLPDNTKALAQVLSAGAWQPIETAPKDKDARVILYGKLLTYCISSNDTGEPFATVVDCGVCRFGKWWVGLYQCLPTHWQPLPPPPKQQEERS